MIFNYKPNVIWGVVVLGLFLILTSGLISLPSLKLFRIVVAIITFLYAIYLHMTGYIVLKDDTLVKGYFFPTKIKLNDIVYIDGIINNVEVRTANEKMNIDMNMISNKSVEQLREVLRKKLVELNQKSE